MSRQEQHETPTKLLHPEIQLIRTSHCVKCGGVETFMINPVLANLHAQPGSHASYLLAHITRGRVSHQDHHKTTLPRLGPKKQCARCLYRHSARASYADYRRKARITKKFFEIFGKFAWVERYFAFEKFFENLPEQKEICLWEICLCSEKNPESAQTVCTGILINPDNS